MDKPIEELELIGRQLENLRDQLKLKQMDIAMITGLSVKTIRSIEQGKEGTAIVNVMLLAKALGASLQIKIKRMSDKVQEMK